MTVVNLSFSGGIESMAMLQMAMEKGFSIAVIIQNLSGTPQGTVAELLATRKTIDFFRNHPDKEKYPGKIEDVYYMLGLPHLNRPETTNYNSRIGELVSNSQSQQWGCIQNLMVFRQASILRGRYPTTWIGWLKEDCTEYSHEEHDFTVAELQEMLHMPTRIGVLGSGDRVARPFRAPLWDMAKKDVWEYIDKDIRDNVIPNGAATYDSENHTLVHSVYGFKQLEYKDAGIPVQETYVLDATSEGEEFHFFLNHFLGRVRAVEFNLPPEAQDFVGKTLKKTVQPNCWMTESDIKILKSEVKWELEQAHKAALKFAWPIPAPTVEVFADVGDGAERVELIGER